MPEDAEPRIRKVEYRGLTGEAGEAARLQKQDEAVRSAGWVSRGRRRALVSALAGAVFAIVMTALVGGGIVMYVLSTLWGLSAGGIVASKRLGHLWSSVLYGMPLIAIRIPATFGAGENLGLQAGYGLGMIQLCSWIFLIVFGGMLSLWVEQERQRTDAL